MNLLSNVRMMTYEVEFRLRELEPLPAPGPGGHGLPAVLEIQRVPGRHETPRRAPRQRPAGRDRLFPGGDAGEEAPGSAEDDEMVHGIIIPRLGAAIAVNPTSN